MQSIRVVVRTRPLLDSEIESGDKDRGITPEEGNGKVTLTNMNPTGTNSNNTVVAEEQSTSRQYSFNKVFGSSTSQDDFFEGSGVKDMIVGCLQGYHATIFAYGQTGSGKTHTMDGFEYDHATKYGGDVRIKQRKSVCDSDGINYSCEGPGITTRALKFLFHKVLDLKQSQGRQFSIYCTYVQIYKEKVFDLLNPGLVHPASQDNDGHFGGSAKAESKTGLKMRWSKRDGFYLEGIYEVSCNDINDALSAFHTGARNKIMASHSLNMQSSRSHSIFTLYIKTYEYFDRYDCDSNNTRNSVDSFSRGDIICSSKLSLVDLAGSERGTTIAKNNNKLFEESVSINKSLFTLRKVIQVLAKSKKNTNTNEEEQQASSHIPYRDSKLTSLLKESLGGKATTLMIACLSSNDKFYEENLSTLEYASLAAKISNRVVINEDPRTKLIRELREEITFLRAQLGTVSSVKEGLRREVAHKMSNSKASAFAAKYQETESVIDNLEKENDDSSFLSRKEELDNTVEKMRTNHILNVDEIKQNKCESSSRCDENKGRLTQDSKAIPNGSIPRYRTQTSNDKEKTSDKSNENLLQLLDVNRILNNKLLESENAKLRYIDDNALLMNENSSLRDKLDLMEAIVSIPPTKSDLDTHDRTKDDKDNKRCHDVAARQIHTASSAVMEELLHLRKENKELQSRKKVDENHIKSLVFKGAQGKHKQRRDNNMLQNSKRNSATIRSESKVGEISYNTGRISSTGYVRSAMAQVVEIAANSSADARFVQERTKSDNDNSESDETQNRLSKLLQTRSEIARNHIKKQSTFNSVSLD